MNTDKLRGKSPERSILIKKFREVEMSGYYFALNDSPIINVKGFAKNSKGPSPEDVPNLRSYIFKSGVDFRQEIQETSELWVTICGKDIRDIYQNNTVSEFMLKVVCYQRDPPLMKQIGDSFYFEGYITPFDVICLPVKEVLDEISKDNYLSVYLTDIEEEIVFVL